MVYSKDGNRLVLYPCALPGTTFNIPMECEEITERAFYLTAVRSFTVSETNEHLTAYNGSVYTKNLKKLVVFPPAQPDGTVLWPTGLEVIGAYAIESVYVKEFIMPSTVISYNYAAMAFSNALTTADVSNGKLFESSTFSNDRQLRSVLLPADMAYMPDSMFRNSGMPRFSFPSTMKIIGSGVFFNNPVTTVNFPEGLVEIQQGAFEMCSKLTDPVFPQSLELIGQSAFASCSSLVHLAFTNAFISCTGIETVTVENCRVTKIHPSAFAYCIYVLDYEYCGPTDAFTANHKHIVRLNIVFQVQIICYIYWYRILLE